LASIIEKELRGDLIQRGGSLCPGCGASIALQYALNTLGRKTVLLTTPGCACMGTLTFDMRNIVKVPQLFTLFENPAAPATGVKAGLDRKGVEINVLCFMGDGGTVDLGLGGVTGVAERGDPIIYVCYDNEAYMNTGIQRSGSTPYGAWTMTTPLGERSRGKCRFRKDMPHIMASSGAAYVATASIAYLQDYVRKIRRAEEVTQNDEGMAYIHVQAPCPTGWRFPTKDTIGVARLAVQTGLWPLLEIYEEESRHSLVPRERAPVREYLMLQGRFRHLTDEQIEIVQKRVDEYWKLGDRA
jgi:pyruvate ferredoxin oxidoreductase beta subunit